MSAQPVRTVKGDGFVHLILDHGVNALDDELLGALSAALDELGGAGAPPLILESSHPRIFSPGWDLKALYGAPSDIVQGLLERFSEVVTDLFAYPGPTAAAIGGHAIAGGCELALACDFRIMAAGRARIGVSEVNLGVPVPAAVLTMLRARLSPMAVEELVFHGDGCTAQRAHELGIVQTVAVNRDVVEVAERELSTQRAKSPLGYRTIKRALYSDAWDTCRRSIGENADDFLRCWFDDATQDRLAIVVRSLGG